MAASLIAIPEVTSDQELVGVENRSADYKVNGRASTFFQYVDWDGNERILGPQRTPVRIKYRSALAVHNRLQLVINPISRTFVMLTTNESGTELDGWEETPVATIDGLRGIPQTLEFIDLNFELPPPENIFSFNSAIFCLRFVMFLIAVIVAIFAVGYIGYFIFQQTTPDS